MDEKRFGNGTVLPVNVEDLIDGNVVEGNRIEFKKGWNPDSIYRSVCAFANDFDNVGGGYIVIGAEEVNGRAVRPVNGIPVEQLDDIEKDMVGFNNLMMPYYQPRISPEVVDGKHVLVLWVTAGDKRPYKVPEQVTAKHKVHQYYIRYGSNSIVAKGEYELELLDLANRVPFDDRGNMSAKVENVSKVLLRDYLVETKSKLAAMVEEMPTVNVLEQMDLVTLPRETMLVKNAALMMFCYNPEKFFPRTQVNIVIFPKGKDEDPDHFTELPPITGPVHLMIRRTLDVIKTLVLKQRVRKVDGQAEAVVTWNYPYKAIEEAVVNALYHRSYQEREPVEINIMPDEVEIISFNGPDRSLNINDLMAGKRVKARRYRNSRLGDFLKELRLTEGKGTGLPTIKRELEKNGSPMASYEVDEDRTYFLVSIPCHKDFVSSELIVDEDGKVWTKEEYENRELQDKLQDKVQDKVPNKLQDKLPNKLPDKLPNKVWELYVYLAEHPKATIPEMADFLGVKERMVYGYLKSLKDQGLLEREGSKKTGRWKVLV